MKERQIYQPPNNNRVLIPICAVLFAAGAAAILLTRIFAYYIWIFQLGGLLLYVAIIQLTTRYIISSFIYVIDDSCLYFYRTSAGKNRELMCVYLDDIFDLVSEPSYKEIEKKYGKIDARYNYCCNIMPKKQYALLFREKNKKTLILFELDAEFAERLRESACISAK